MALFVPRHARPPVLALSSIFLKRSQPQLERIVAVRIGQPMAARGQSVRADLDVGIHGHVHSLRTLSALR